MIVWHGTAAVVARAAVNSPAMATDGASPRRIEPFPEQVAGGAFEVAEHDRHAVFFGKTVDLLVNDTRDVVAGSTD